jgi:hypothetical protein
VYETVAGAWQPADADFLRGYLGGIFDAEGSVTGNADKACFSDLKLCQDEINAHIKGRIAYALDFFGFSYTWEPKWLRIKGGIRERMRFLSLSLPACRRKTDRIATGASLLGARTTTVLAIEDGGVDSVYNVDEDVSGGVRSFFTNVYVHGCRYVGQDGIDPANRFNTPAGYCQSFRAAITGLLQAWAIEKRIQPAAVKVPAKAGPALAAASRPVAGESRPVVNSTEKPRVVTSERGGIAALTQRFL